MASEKPLPKPRARYKRDRRGSEDPTLSNQDLEGVNLQTVLSNVTKTPDEPQPPTLGPDLGSGDHSLATIDNIITVPGQAGVVRSTSIPSPCQPCFDASLDPASLDPASLDLASLDPASLDPASLDPASLDLASLDPASLDLASLDLASLDPASLDPASIDPASIDSMINSIETHIPSLAGVASAVARPAHSVSPVTSPAHTVSAATSYTPNLDDIVSSLASHIPSLAGMVGFLANPEVSPITSESFSQETTNSSLLHDAGSTPAVPDPESPSAKGEDESYLTVLPHWAGQDEPESSNEDEEAGELPVIPDVDYPMEIVVEKPHNTTNNNIQPAGLGITPCRPPPPPPPHHPAQLRKQIQKTPRAATIRVSRKKKKTLSPKQSAEVRVGSWLDTWRGFRHSVLWATLDRQLMSLWKKRTDKFSEVMFHLSSITKVKQQDKGRFSIYFRKRHYDFMAHSDVVQKEWITSLLASRGQASPAPPQHQGPITIKDPRNRVYAAVFGHELWVYHNKEDYQLGVAWFLIPLNVAAVKAAGKKTFNLVTPYRTFSVAVDSTADLSVWQDCLSASILSALSCSQVALRLWDNPCNKVCGDCGAASPEWASINLLLLLCEACAGQHRSLSSSLSKVRSLKLDNKVWTEPLIQLFCRYGNWLANQIWSPAVAAEEQLLPTASDEERSEFIRNKYTRGRYRRPHPLAQSPLLINQRLCEVVCGDDIQETLALLCSGAKVSCQSYLPDQSPVSLAEGAGQELQVVLLQLNEYLEIPPFLPLSANGITDSDQLGGDEEELHGKLEEDRFFFSLENDSAACDVLDLREVRTVLLRSSLEFEMVTLADRLFCAADKEQNLESHLLHILQVILPVGVPEVEMGGALAVSRVGVVREGVVQPDAWAVLKSDGVTLYSEHQEELNKKRMVLDAQANCEMDLNENTINLLTGERSLCLRFEDDYSCHAWFNKVKMVLTNHNAAPVLYQLLRTGRVPLAVERCINHVTQHGLKVVGMYRRCGLATKVSRLVEALGSCPDSAPMEDDEQGVLDVGSALKQYVRQQPPLFPPKHQELWVKAAGDPDERSRLAAYRWLIRQLPVDNRATLSALIGHFYMIQMFSSQNQMTAQNLALVLVPTLFQELGGDLVRLIREMIIHHRLLFLSVGKDKEEQITVF